MSYAETTALHKIAALNKRIRAVQGGSSAGKTIAILLYLIGMAQTDDKPTLTSVVSVNIPHLKRGAMRDFKNIMQDHHYWNDDNWNATDSIYTFETGSQIEFFSTENGDKLRGGRRDRCFMNEANLCHDEAFFQLALRTKEFFYLDWNPTNEFWFYSEVLGQRDDVDHIIITYKDNEALSEEIVSEIENLKGQKWRVYGLGLLGEVEGRIFTGWTQIDEIPHEARRVGRGLDFGYSIDPTAVIDIYEYNGGYILDEVVYRKGMLNSEIANTLKEGDILTVADSAEPKSIDEIKSYGITIVPAEKGKDSILHGIQIMQDQKFSVTKRSMNIWREYNNYMWDRDKDGRWLQRPENGFDHSLDAIRYFMQRHLKKNTNDVSNFYENLKYKRQQNRSSVKAGLR